MFDFLTQLIGTRAEDGTHGLAGLNLRMTEFAYTRPKEALAIIVALILVIGGLIFLIAS
jgi:hypothetical protein